MRITPMLALLVTAFAMAQMRPLPTEADVPRLRAEAEKGDAVALYQLAVCNDEAIGMELNTKAAFDLALRAAEKGDVPAMVFVSGTYEFGAEGIPADTSASRKWAERAAKTDDPLGLVALAFCHRSGAGFEKSESEFLRLLRQAADAGNAHAAGLLAQELLASRDPEGLRWAEKAAEQGDRRGEAMLARAYFYGLLVTKDLEVAERHARRGAERNNGECHLTLALLATEATKPDYTKAIPHLRRAAVLGNARAGAILGTMYFQGTKGLERDYAKARQFCRVAAAKGDGLGMFCYGVIIHDGRGRTADEVLGSGIIQAAAKLGDGGAKAWVAHGGAREFTSATFGKGTQIADSILQQFREGGMPRELAEGYVRETAK